MLARVLASGALSGLIAGLVLGLLLLLIMTPLIIEAEKFEGHPGKQAGGGSMGRNVGTILGSIILGTAYGLILAVVWYWLTKNKKVTRPLIKGLILGGIGFMIVALIPSFGFPPNPPGMETKYPATIRQSWWLAIIGLEIVCLWLYRWFNRRLIERGWSGTGARVCGLLIFLPVLVPFMVGIPNQIIKTAVPPDLLTEFRLGSLMVLLIFWLLLGGALSVTFEWLSKD